MASRSRSGGILAAFAAVVVAASACSGTAPSSAPTPPTASTEPGSTVAASAAAEAVTLVHWNWYAGSEAQFDAVDELFMASHPNIKIEQVPWPAEWLEKARSAVAAKKGPDVMSAYGGSHIAGLQQGLVPLQDKLTDEQKADLRFIDMSYSPDGNLYSMPVSAATSAFLFNKTLFAKAGLDAEKPPQNWQELLMACDALRAAGIEPVGAGWKDGFGADYFMWVGSAQGLTDEKRAAWRKLDLPLTDPGIAIGVNAARELDARGCFQEGADGRLYYNEIKESFDAGESAMVMWPAGYNGTTIVESEKAFGEGNLGVFPIPAFPGAVRPDGTDAGPFAGYTITSFSEHPDEAWEYISFLASKEAQDLRWAEFDIFPNHNRVDTTSDEPVVQKLLDIAASPNNYALWLHMPDSVMGNFRQNAARLVHGEIDVAPVFEEMDATHKQVTSNLR